MKELKWENITLYVQKEGIDIRKTDNNLYMIESKGRKIPLKLSVMGKKVEIDTECDVLYIQRNLLNHTEVKTFSDTAFPFTLQINYFRDPIVISVETTGE